MYIDLRGRPLKYAFFNVEEVELQGSSTPRTFPGPHAKQHSFCVQWWCGGVEGRVCLTTMVDFLTDQPSSAVWILCVLLVGSYPSTANEDMVWIIHGFLEGNAFDDFVA